MCQVRAQPRRSAQQRTTLGCGLHGNSVAVLRATCGQQHCAGPCVLAMALTVCICASALSTSFSSMYMSAAACCLLQPRCNDCLDSANKLTEATRFLQDSAPMVNALDNWCSTPALQAWAPAPKCAAISSRISANINVGKGLDGCATVWAPVTLPHCLRPANWYRGQLPPAHLWSSREASW